MVLAIGPLIWWLCRSLNQDSDKGTRSGSFSGKRRIQTPDLGHLGVAAFVLMIAIGLCTFTVLLSLSRGGSVSMFLGVAICVLVLHRGSLLNGKTVLFLLVTGALLAACLGIYGYDMVSSRLERVQYTELVEGNSGRAGIWRADAAAITDFPFTGSGAASHAQVYPMYLPDDEVNQHVEYVHADNSYVEIGLEAGITGLILVAAAIGLGVWWCWASLRSCTSRGAMLCMAGIAASLAASVIHAICDFVWYVPACVVPVLLLAAGASRLRHISAGSHEAGRHSLFTPRVAWAAGLVGVGLLAYPVITATWAGLRAEPSWQQSDVQVRKLAALDPSARRDALASIAAELTEVVRWQPDHAIAHARLAEVHVQLFNHSQDSGTTLNARQVRQTAMASAGHFRGNDDLQQWLGRAVGRPWEHLHLAQQHARQALGLCPLLANAYLALATAGFVEGQPAPSPVACVEQALRVRPFDGTVLFEAGQEALLSGDLDRALELWRRSFQCGSYHQQRLFNLLVDRAPAEFFLQTFTMDLAAIKRLAASFVKAGRPDQRQAILRPLAEIARREARQSDPVKAKAAWLEAARAHQQIGEMAERLECLQNAVRCDSSDYDSRLALGMALCQANQVAEAKEHLTWCLRRKPRDEKVRSLLDKLLNQELHVAERPDRKRGS